MEQIAKRPLAIFKVILSEWLADNQMDGSPLSYIKHPNGDLSEGGYKEAIAHLEAAHFEVLPATGDWVEVAYSVDDRQSILHPGDWVIVWTDGKVSVLHNVSEVAYAGDTVSVVF